MQYFCGYCGSQIFETDRNCKQCGAPLNTSFATKKETLKVSASENRLNSPCLKLIGWTNSACIELSQKICAWNQGKPVTLVCSKRILFSILPQDYNYLYNIESPYEEDMYMKNFFGLNIITNRELLEKLIITMGGSESCVYFVCLENEKSLTYGKTIGRIQVDDRDFKKDNFHMFKNKIKNYFNSIYAE